MALDEELAEAMGEPIAQLHQLSAGASRETWSFSTPGHGQCILQRLPRGAARASVDLEVAVLQAAPAAGVPVAQVLSSWPQGGPLGTPAIVLEALPGESLPQRLMRDQRYAPALEGLAGQCGQILARLHSIDPGAVPGLTVQDPIDRCYAVLDELPDRHPAFELVLRRLDLTRPRRRPASVVHGDFRLGNLLIGEAGVTAVLDWELVHLADPLEDLGISVSQLGGSADPTRSPG